MVEPTEEALLQELNVAINEADWVGARLWVDRRAAAIDLRVLALPENGPEPPELDRIVRLLLFGVGRVTASLRHGRWDDETAVVEVFSLEDLDKVVRSFNAQPVYGWHFFNPPEATWEHWRNRLSLDVRIEGGSEHHVIDLFQESRADPERHFDLRIWFRHLSAYDRQNQPKDIYEVAAAGRRWWDGLYAGDPRTQRNGIVPISLEGQVTSPS